MAEVIAALVVVAVIVVLNLLLTLALARRLRLMDEKGGSSSEVRKLPVPEIGHVVQPFEVQTTRGSILSEVDFNASSSLVVFASVGCSPCEALKTELVASPPSEVLRVFVQGGDVVDQPALATELEAVAEEVAWLGADQQVSKAFGEVRAFPTILRVVNGVVVASATQLREIPKVERELTRV